MRERMRWLVVALAAVMVVAVVGTAPASKDTLVIGMPTDVPIFDTHKATGLHNGSILNQVSEPLVRLTSDGKVVPWLVESWEQSRTARRGRCTRARASSSPTARRSTPRRCGSISSASASTRSARPRWRWSSRWRSPASTTLKITTEAPFAPFINSLGYHWIVVVQPDADPEGRRRQPAHRAGRHRPLQVRPPQARPGSAAGGQRSVLGRQAEAARHRQPPLPRPGRADARAGERRRRPHLPRPAAGGGPAGQEQQPDRLHAALGARHLDLPQHPA